jgi:hypothetical protein
LSCRRFIERLANALYPPRDEPVGGRNLGPQEYRNRLWAYVDEKLSGTNRDFVLASLEDVGRRIDRLDSLANRGLHVSEVTAAEVQRLLIGMVTLTHDILTLEPPPTIARSEPYEEGVRRLFEEALRQSDELDEELHEEVDDEEDLK